MGKNPGRKAEKPAKREGFGAKPGAFFGIPLPTGATAILAGTIRWEGLPFFLVSDLDLNPAEFGEFVHRTFKVEGSPDRVLEFLRENRGDWEERFSTEREGGGVLFWTRDNGQAAAWIAASKPGRNTELAIALAERAHPRD